MEPARSTGNFVSIPDRVLGIFRLDVVADVAAPGYVSIPDRVLGIFRPEVKNALEIKNLTFQSLIGF